VDSKDEHEEVLTRINVLTLRNALHLAWLRDQERTITIADMEKAIQLAQYQITQRRNLIVVTTDNALACHQQKILRFLRRHGPSTRKVIRKGTHGGRVGTELFDRALDGLANGEEIVKLPTAHKNSFVFALPEE
jgi:hypothetical protein